MLCDRPHPQPAFGAFLRRSWFGASSIPPLGAFSLDLEIAAYVFARDWSHFLQIQEELLLRVMEIVQKAGAQIAFPSQTMYLTADSGGDRASRAAALAPDKEVDQEAAATKSA